MTKRFNHLWMTRLPREVVELLSLEVFKETVLSAIQGPGIAGNNGVMWLVDYMI